MEVFEAALLIAAYTVLVIALFLEVICYRKHIETRETIAFTASILLLVVALTFTWFADSPPTSNHTNIYILLAMTLVGVTTPLNVLVERQHVLHPAIGRVIVALGFLLGALLLAGYGMNLLGTLQYVVAGFVGASVVGSMVLIRMTKPQGRMIHRERLEQRMALLFIVIIPLSLFADFYVQQQAWSSKTGFAAPALFILLGISKIWDDIQRLSLVSAEINLTERDLDNYAFTNREKEVALLLVEGHTYKKIGEQLFISMPTVKTHVSNIYRKCKVNNRLELMKLLGKG